MILLHTCGRRVATVFLTDYYKLNGFLLACSFQFFILFLLLCKSIYHTARHLLSASTTGTNAIRPAAVRSILVYAMLYFA
jgi:hypothetical protein